MSDPNAPHTPADPAAQPASDPAGADPAAAAAVASPEAQLLAAQAEAAQMKDAWLRALADTENVRKRARTDVADANKYAIGTFAAELLAVKDTLEMALADQVSTADQIRMGVDLTLKNLAAAFEKAKIVESNPVNQKFDPNLHEAISQIESDQPANTVVQVFRKGYKLHDRVLRTAMVAVSKGKPGETGGAGTVETQG